MMKIKVVGPFDYSQRMKAGQIVEVDAIRKSDVVGGYSLRVIGIWKRPRWFSIAWFVVRKINKQV